MPELWGRLSKGETARLELVDYKIMISVQRGFIGKKMIPFQEISMAHVNSVELIEADEPFAGSQRLTVRYRTASDELSFYTTQEDVVKEIHIMISEEIARREEKLRVQIREFKETRELQLNMLYQDLEMVDLIFNFVIGLSGEIDWQYLREALEGMKQVQLEMDALGSSHYKFSLEGLELELRMRHIKEMKNEIFELLELVLQGITEASSHPVEWFNERYHYLFVSTLFLMRNKELAEITGIIDTSEDRRLGQQVEALMALVESEHIEMEAFGAEDFDRARLYLLSDILLKVPFTPRS